MPTIIKQSQSRIRKITDHKQAVHYVDKDISPDVSLVRAEFTDYSGDHTATTDLIYYVIEGSVVIDFGKMRDTLEVHDACFIERDTEYRVTGTAKVIVINQPAFSTIDPSR